LYPTREQLPESPAPDGPSGEKPPAPGDSRHGGRRRGGDPGNAPGDRVLVPRWPRRIGRDRAPRAHRPGKTPEFAGYAFTSRQPQGCVNPTASISVRRLASKAPVTVAAAPAAECRAHSFLPWQNCRRARTRSGPVEMCSAPAPSHRDGRKRQTFSLNSPRAPDLHADRPGRPGAKPAREI